jgi:hypothetical protein
MPKTIPLTPIVERYRDLPHSREARLTQARELAANPAPLAADYAQSVEQFSTYENDERFYDQRVEHEIAPLPIRRTIDLALRLRTAGGLAPDPNGSGSVGELPKGVRAVASEQLGFDYCDREIVAARTTGGASFDDGSSATRALRLDLLLVARHGRVPTVGEVKLKTDKDPFAALIQALACAAHLATQSQYARLTKTYPEARFTTAGEQPRLDLLLLLGDLPEQGTHLPQLRQATRDLAAALLTTREVSASVRRIACFDFPLDVQPVRASVRFAFESS